MAGWSWLDGHERPVLEWLAELRRVKELATAKVVKARPAVATELIAPVRSHTARRAGGNCPSRRLQR